jgi:hypothetical protein
MDEYNRRKKQIEDSEKIAIVAVGAFVILVLVLAVINLFS